MAVRVANPNSSPLPLPYPFRGVLKAGASVVLALTLDQVRVAMGDAAAQCFRLREVPDLVGDAFALGVYGVEPTLPQLIQVPDATLLLSKAHFGNYLRFAGACTVTVPAGLGLSETLVQSVLMRQVGAGQITVVGSGTVITPRATLGLKSAGQGATICLAYVSGEAYELTGDAAA